MFNKVVKNAAVVLLGSLLMLGNASAKDLKIGIVNVNAIAAQMPEMATVEQRVMDEFKNQREELQKVQSDLRFNTEKFQREETTMSEDQKKELIAKVTELRKVLETKGKPLNTAMQKRGQEEQNKVLVKIQQAINELAKNGEYDLIFRSESLVFAKDGNDISDKVLEAAKKK